MGVAPSLIARVHAIDEAQTTPLPCEWLAPVLNATLTIASPRVHVVEMAPVKVLLNAAVLFVTSGSYAPNVRFVTVNVHLFEIVA